MNLDIDTPSFPQAQCVTLEDKDFFFPKQGKQEAERLPQLRQLCFSCIHREECLGYALDREIQYGIWGGKTPRERYLIRRENRNPIGDLAAKILQLHYNGSSINEIARKLDTSLGYARRCIERYATSKGVNQSHQEKERDSSR